MKTNYEWLREITQDTSCSVAMHDTLCGVLQLANALKIDKKHAKKAKEFMSWLEEEHKEDEDSASDAEED